MLELDPSPGICIFPALRLEKLMGNLAVPLF
jgi:hypothetical protein